jgi:glycosyltransferase involved in cell wall biosynthesis
VRQLRIFGWHVHGSYMNSFVQGKHQYFLASLPNKGPYGLGRADTWRWPSSVSNISPINAAALDVDIVLLQRPEEIEMAEAWLGGRRPGRDVPAVYLEHNTPQGCINDMVHPLCDRPSIPVVHVTPFNRLFWNCGSSPTHVIEHGVVDPGYCYTGEIDSAAVVINEPVRRARVTGTDLVQHVRGENIQVDLFGMKSEAIGGIDVPQDRLHAELAQRRLYLHTARWTSLGLSLIESMMLGLPVALLSVTEAAEVIPSDIGVKTNDVEALTKGIRHLLNDREEAALLGKRARDFAVHRFGLSRFLSDWDTVLSEVIG